MRRLAIERRGTSIGVQDKDGYWLSVGDTVKVRYWHGFEFVGPVRYDRRLAAFVIDMDPICEMDFARGTTLELLKKGTTCPAPTPTAP